MHNNDILILKNHEVVALFSGRESEIVQAVAAAYQIHAGNQSSLPHSLFLSFPDHARNRIIALPAYLGGDFSVAGMKWIASFPDNLQQGLERASAVVILNSPQTGRPEAILEGSTISAKRTAASAALAARSLQNGQAPREAALVGCGLINFEIAKFLLQTCPQIERFIAYDISPERAEQFGERCREAFDGTHVEVTEDIETALSSARVISLATTAVEPHISDLSACAPGTTILHISLRDLTPEVILECDNVVDDVDHVCRAQTSIHLAEQLAGHRDFIRCTLADILNHTAPPRKDDNSITVFSPFGLGVLDMALAKMACDLGVQQGKGTVISSFLPDSWNGQARRLRRKRQTRPKDPVTGQRKRSCTRNSCSSYGTPLVSLKR